MLIVADSLILASGDKSLMLIRPKGLRTDIFRGVCLLETLDHSDTEDPHHPPGGANDISYHDFRQLLLATSQSALQFPAYLGEQKLAIAVLLSCSPKVSFVLSPVGG